MVRSMDEKQYKNLKKQLPYFVGSIFHPPIRRKEHFAVANYLILDLDYLEAANLSIETLMDDLKKLPQVALLFKSPSGDGLKVVFQLKTPCSDAALFSAFYKLFAHRFAKKNELQAVIDYKTSDVTRACFLSYDADAYFNPDCQKIDIQAFIPDLNFGAAEKDLKEVDTIIRKNQTQQLKKKTETLADNTFQKIKDKLNPSFRNKQKKTYYIPPQVESIIAHLTEQLVNFELQLVDTQPISYGRKIKIANEGVWAELNIFYGKKGFKVVPTTKTGSNAELASIAAQVVTQIIATFPTSSTKA